MSIPGVGNHLNHSPLKFSMFIRPDPDEDELLFARQLGMDCVYTWLEDHQRSVEYLTRLRQRVNDAGLELYNAGSMTVGKSDQIHLGLPGRNEKIEAFNLLSAALARPASIPPRLPGNRTKCGVLNPVKPALPPPAGWTWRKC